MHDAVCCRLSLAVGTLPGFAYLPQVDDLAHIASLSLGGSKRYCWYACKADQPGALGQRPEPESSGRMLLNRLACPSPPWRR